MCLKPLSVSGTIKSQYHEGVDLWVDLRVDLRADLRVDLWVDTQLVGDVNMTLFTPEKQSEWWS